MGAPRLKEARNGANRLDLTQPRPITVCTTSVARTMNSFTYARLQSTRYCHDSCYNGLIRTGRGRGPLILNCFISTNHQCAARCHLLKSGSPSRLRYASQTPTNIWYNSLSTEDKDMDRRSGSHQYTWVSKRRPEEQQTAEELSQTNQNAKQFSRMNDDPTQLCNADPPENAKPMSFLHTGSSKTKFGT